ncbi:MAG: hypothetical protein QW794_03810 [Thermosphaera sp.]
MKRALFHLGNPMSNMESLDKPMRRKQRRGQRRRLKTETIAVRIAPRFKRILEQLAISEGLDLSSWMRNLILKELKARGLVKEAEVVGAVEEMLSEAEGEEAG